MRAIVNGLLLLPLGLLGGCATLTKGTVQAITVDTDPSGATCTLARDAKTLAVINPTPGTVPIDKAYSAIAVGCRRAGYQDANGTLTAEFQPVTLGNVLLGGIIGLVVDAASGAAGQYPASITLTMVPSEFASAEARDAYFDRMRGAVTKEMDALREQVAQQCPPLGNCDGKLEAARAETARKLAEIEQRRAASKVVENPVSSAPEIAFWP